jgi:tripartite-type tricarboxylate transporter receptor subunit TctC
MLSTTNCWNAAITSVCVALSAVATAAAESRVSFAGKTITMLVGSEPGGGTDASARVIAPYLRKYLPGEPNILVQNMPGAGGITALNYLVHRSRPDGLTAIMGSVTMIDPINFRRAGAQYDPKTFRFAGGIGRGSSVIFIKRSAEPRLYDKAARPVVIGSALAIPRSAMQPALWGIEYLGWNAVWVTGYHGTNEVMLALDRGEVEMTSTANLFQIQDRLASGELKLVNQTGTLENGRMVGRPEFGDAPLFLEQMAGRISDPVAQRAFEYWVALDRGDKWLALAPGTPDSVLAAYREAFARMAVDRDFLRRGEKISDDFTPMGPRDVEAIAQTLADTPPDAIDYTKSLMRKQGIRVQ